MLTAISALAGFLEEGGLQTDWRRTLGMDVIAAAAQGPVSVDLLSAGELARYHGLRDADRRRSWLTGRAALKRLLRRLDLAPDTSRLEFPAIGLSLSHSGGMALAVACRSALEGSAARGLGVDLEADRPMRPEAARFFLAPEEWDRIHASGSEPGSALLRAWTAKEAVFKSDPGNRGRMLLDYRLADAAAPRGSAFRRSGGLSPGLSAPDGVTGRFRYRSHHLAGWHISVAARSGDMHG